MKLRRETRILKDKAISSLRRATAAFNSYEDDGLTDIGRHLGVSKQRAHQLFAEGRLPAPAGEIQRGRYWKPSDVRSWGAVVGEGTALEAAQARLVRSNAMVHGIKARHSPASRRCASMHHPEKEGPMPRSTPPLTRWGSALPTALILRRSVMSPSSPIRYVAIAGVIALSVLVGPAAAAAPGDIMWSASYGVPEQVERGLDSAVAPDGSRLYVTGVDAEGQDGDFITLAYEATTGSEVWASSYDAGQRDEARRVGVAPDGSRIYVVGRSRSEETSADYATVAYVAATGEELWVARHHSTGRRRDEPSCIAVSDTTVFVTGASRGDGNFDFASVAYDAATGQELWTARFDRRESADYAQGCTVAPDGSAFFVTGRNHIGQRDAASAVTIAYSSSSGRPIWTDRYDGPKLGWDEGIAATISPDGAHLYVVGRSNRGRRTSPDYLTISYDATSGSVEWRRLDGDRDFAAALDVATSPDGSAVFVTGSSGGGSTVRTLGYSTADGTELWARTYRVREFGLGNSLAVAPDGSAVYVAGWEAFQSFALAYDAISGATLWERHEPASAWGSVSTSPESGVVYMAGIIAVGEDRNIFSAAYEG